MLVPNYEGKGNDPAIHKEMGWGGVGCGDGMSVIEFNRF